MPEASSLRRRIVAVFVLFGVVLSILVAMLAAIAVEGIEASLVDDRLAEVAKWALPRDAAGLEVDLPAGLRFHRGSDIPPALRGLPAGVSDPDLGRDGVHVLSGADARGPYVVVDHESDYEKVELVVYAMFAASFAVFVLLAAMLGAVVGRRVVAPISALAAAVDAGATPLPETGREDELGFLARALDSHTTDMKRVLDRERFFTGDVSHELRTPLMVIAGAAEILLAEPMTAALHAAAQRIARAAREAAECIDVLLLLAREPYADRLAPVSLRDLAWREVERYQPMMAGKPVILLCLGDAPLPVRAPPELCACLVGNLIRNACQYTEQGSVTVMIEDGLLSVEDTGPGLPDAVRVTLGHGDRAAPSSGSAGTGLGLSLVARICDYLGASFSYQDRVNGGSRFVVGFPALQARAENN
ncbi:MULTISPECIES: sensor histidine kinase [Massilia]|uniref:histidine kinase n=1 Tax=Massilia timonae TaxID=47229 RepID=A0A1S2NCM3_9BURK|nr:MULTISPECIES: HAMP domain-containing sensor histidine kinase [Massilia]OIJ42729.1 HAMP domain protein [Massilia timonae]